LKDRGLPFSPEALANAAGFVRKPLVPVDLPHLIRVEIGNANALTVFHTGKGDPDAFSCQQVTRVAK